MIFEEFFYALVVGNDGQATPTQSASSLEEITAAQFSSSKLEVGSSAKINFGRWINPNPIANRCF